MFRLAICGFIFALLTGCNTAPSAPPQNSGEAEAPAPIPQHKIVAFGDSLTEGYGLSRNESYPAQLQEKLQREGYAAYEVINAGVSGETTSGARARAQWIASLEPEIVILESGANDALRGIDLNLTRKNLEDIISELHRADITVILAGMQITENLGQDYADQFTALFPELAQKYDLPLIPFFLEGVAANSALNLSDEIHPTAEGYRIIVENNVWPVLKAVLSTQ